MLIENKYGLVKLDWKTNKKLLLLFSGGADSTLLLWLTLNAMKTRPETTLQVFTGVTPQKGLFKQFTSQENFDMMREEFKHIKDRVFDRIIIYNKTQEELADQAEKLHIDEKYDITMYAITSNPPYEIMKTHDLLRRREKIRDQKETPKEEWGTDSKCIRYRPLVNVDKRWVAQCYEDFNLWRFYNNTISCERFRETTDMRYSEEPCKHCWWCREKKMAFGMYDGGVR